MLSTPARRRRPLALVLTAALAAAGPLALSTPALASHAPANEVVFVHETETQAPSLRLRNLQTGATSVVLPADNANGWFYGHPELTPDSEQIVVSTDRGSPQFLEGIARVNRTGTGFVRLTNPPMDAFDDAPKVSPNGATVLFTRYGFDTAFAELFTVPLAGGTPVRIAAAGNRLQGADWSPDGTRIVFSDGRQTNAIGDGRLRVLTPATGAITDLAAFGDSPDWSPDGSTIAHVAFSDQGSRIGVVPADGSAGRTLTRSAGSGELALGAGWLPDSESIVYTRVNFGTGAVDLWAVDRFDTRAAAVVASGADEYTSQVRGPALAPVKSGAASRFTAFETPGRVLDTRKGVGSPATRLGAGQTLDLQVTGILPTADGGFLDVPPTATAVVLNVTAVRPSSGTFLTAFPTGADVPASSNVNAAAGANVPNLVTVRVGRDGKVSLFNRAGTVDVLADLAGFYDSTGDGYTALAPKRILDTRTSTSGDGAGKVAGIRDLTVTGTVPVAGGGTVTIPPQATAVVLNVTATAVSAGTDVRVYPRPADDRVPTVSNLNVVAGQTVANLVTVTVGDEGKVRLRTSAGEMHLIADVAGYYLPGSGDSFVPVDPARFLDSRNGTGTLPAKVGAGQFADLKVAGSRGVPAQATAAVLNLTVTGVADTGSTDVRAYPRPADASTPPPTVSNLNATAGATLANLAVVATGNDGRVRVRNNLGTTHLIGDLAGYFVAPAG